MKKELKDRNKVIRETIKEHKDEIVKIQGKTQAIVKQGQTLQQEIAQNNTEILKHQGALEALEKMISK